MTDKHQFDGHRVRISDVFDLQMGKTPSRKNPLYWRDGNHDWVSIADLGSFGKYVGKTKERINDFAVKESGIKLTPANTVLMSFKLSLGKTSITTEPVYTNEAIMAFINKGLYPVDTSFMYHQCRSKDWAAGTNAAVMGKTLNKRTLGQSVIFLPSLEEQEDIAAKLDFIDEQLQKAKDVLHELDSLVKSRFVEMFGDPIRNPLRMSVSSVEELAAPIKNSMKAGPFGSALKKEVYAESGYKVYGQEQVISGDQFLGNYYIDKAKYEQLNSCKVMPGDVLISLVGTVGKVLILSEDCQPGIINPRLVKITFDKRKIFPEYFAIAFSLESVRSSLLGRAHGQTMNVLNLGMIKKLKLPVPPISRQKEYLNFVAQADKSRFVAQQQIEKLQMLYDSFAQEYFGD
ncbi:restriction endonuclease subunit S [Bifidobacterium pseudocatenulatum]|uniref:restriction endonuclease subunit S n=1 Tax=Bifidobacterium pseudocatenulatum TaxID=28026 RepID=UPI001CFC7F1E|nr:restriction endonuclease subunit S [Bifidobacterium pseudocatenulatum]MCB4897959.1 restriction endonuclease subunit S [Bifidobacterium pseudocatenulatum]